jgi:hypothetical protein
MQPGGALVQDNWMPTMKGAKLRGGCVRYCDLHAYPLWANNTAYTVGTKRTDATDGSMWNCAVAHTSAAAGTFAADRAAHPTFWTATTALPLTDPARKPIISGFEYLSGSVAKMYAANATTLYDVTGTLPVQVKSGQASGNYCASQMANASGDYLMVVNDAGDFPLRFDGTTWTTLNGGQITGGPAGGTGQGLTYVWKYRNRWFFIGASSMNAYYLGLNSVQGALSLIPLSGAATKGGKLLFGATWSIDAGDGIDDKCVFCTDQGELLIFSGSDPSNAATWKQEGRYQVSAPMGMNAHMPIGGDLLIATVDGIVPVSQAITKDAGQLELAALTRTIKPMWRDEVAAKRSWAWTMRKWDEYGGVFVTWPGGAPGARYCAAANNVTGAWCRFVGWDATCFMKIRADMFFGTQAGIVMQADRTGYDDGVPYVATLVGGWEMFGAQANTVTWRQARASFLSSAGQPFQPQLDATTDYEIVVPPPPSAGPDPGLAEVWDQGLWDHMRWDQSATARPPVRNTMWVSIGKTGFAHAPITQVTVGQQAKPDVEMIAISATYEIDGVTV